MTNTHSSSRDFSPSSKDFSSENSATENSDFPRRFASFFAAGTTGFLVDATLLLVFTSISHWSALPARLLSFWAAVGCTWALNRRYTFTDVNAEPKSLLGEYLRYLISQSIGGVLNLSVYAFMLWRWPAFEATPLLPLVCGSLAGLIFNYLAARHFVFVKTGLKAG